MDHDLDHLDPNLPLCDVVQDLYNVQIHSRKHVFRSCRLYGFHSLGNMVI